ncbi:MAG: ATP-dependent Clp protease adaptor protein ClpS [Thermoleophilia bacterium]|nr:ATP-dependent Clp protease adaptor protein ClpS [Thermoleophilia bacterium]
MASGDVIELERVVGPGTNLGGGAKVVVLNDDHNTFEGVAMALSRVLPGVDFDGGLAFATRIHTEGRAEVWSGSLEVAELYWQQLRDSGLTMAPIERG